MLVVEHAAHAGALMDPEHVRGGEADVVVLEDEPAFHMLGAFVPALDPAGAAGLVVVVDAADMGDHDRLVVLLHPVEHLGLARQVPDALPRQLRIGRVEQHVLRGVEREADVVGPRLGAEGASSASLSATMPWNCGMSGWVA